MTVISLRNAEHLAETEISDHAYSVLTRGYSLIEGALTDGQCDLLRKSMLEATRRFDPVEGSERSYLDKYQIHDLFNQDANFVRLLEDPRLQQIISPHLGPFWIMYAATSSAVPPQGKNYANRIHTDSPRFSKDYTFNMGVIWTLDEYTSDNGALRVLPASHHLDQEPSPEYFEKNAVPVLCPRGSLIFFHAGLYHQAGENRTDDWRCSMTMNVCRSFMKPRMDWVRFVKDDISESLNDQARRLLGFDTRVPTSLEEFFLPESERLYKAGQG